MYFSLIIIINLYKLLILFIYIYIWFAILNPVGQSHIKIQLHVYYPLNINHSPSLGVGLDPTVSRQPSEEFKKQVGPV